MASKKKANEELRARFSHYLTEWTEFFGLAQSWDIFLTIEEPEGKASGGHEAGAELSVQLPYRRAFIQVSPDMADASERTIERCALHEAVHILHVGTATLVQDPHNQKVIQAHLEGVVDTLTRAYLRLKYGPDIPSVGFDPW